MEPIQFLATMEDFHGDKFGESVIKFCVPYSDREKVGEVGKWVAEMLIVTVVRQKDVSGHSVKAQEGQKKKRKTKGGKS